MNNNLLEKQEDKLAYLVKIAALVVSFVSVFWTLFYIFTSNWHNAVLESSFVFMGGLAGWYSAHKNFRGMAYVAIPIFFLGICTFCVFLDVPNEVVQRTTHSYLLPLAVYAYMIYPTRYLRVLVFSSIVLVYLVFATTNLGIDVSSVSDNDRVIVAWGNNIAAIGMLCFSVYVLQSEYEMRNALELELSKALLKNEIKSHFQPQVDIDGRTTGAEVLARWNHPVFGTIMPNTFIPIAEKTDLILHLGKRVLDTACHQLVSWSKHPQFAHLTLSVNVSAKQFQDPDFLQSLITLLNDTKADANKLVLEVTESVVAGDLQDIASKMKQLRSLGIKFSLDDFGTGYSSLAYVKNLPLDELKIDKSFITDVLTNKSDAAITKMIIALAKELGVKVIAEGVETKQHRQFLIKRGCFNFQGYLFSPPLPIDAFNDYVIATSGGERPVVSTNNSTR